MLSYIYQTRLLKDGLFLVGLVFLCSWGCDTCAYCVGVLIGKHKMAPKLSPKKSIEGGIGGLAGAALLGALYALAINKWGGASAGVGEYALICFVAVSYTHLDVYKRQQSSTGKGDPVFCFIPMN